MTAPHYDLTISDIRNFEELLEEKGPCADIETGGDGFMEALCEAARAGLMAREQTGLLALSPASEWTVDDLLAAAKCYAPKQHPLADIVVALFDTKDKAP